MSNRKIPKADLDYVELYAKQLKVDNKLFEQQKMLLESQMHASYMLFKQWFGTGKRFRVNARNYLREIGLL